MDWSDSKRQQQEQERPLPLYTKVTAMRDFQAQHSHDLPFSCGDQLTVLEPCNVIFWYLAEDAQGRRGVIPITHVQVGDTPPPPPLPAKSPPVSPPSTSSTAPSHIPTATPLDQRQRMPSPLTMPRSSSDAHPAHLLRSLSTEHNPPSPPPKATPPPTRKPPLLPPRPPAKKKPLDSEPPDNKPQVPPLESKLLGSPTRSPKKPLLPLSPINKRIPLTPKARNIDRRAPVPLPTRGTPIDIDNRPPAPLPPEAFEATNSNSESSPAEPEHRKYASAQEFIEKSGWFQPSLEAVLCRKASMHLPVFKSMSLAIYVFKHKFSDNKQYVGKSHSLFSGLIQMFHRLYDRPEDKLNPLEWELKYQSPDADEWYVRFIPVMNLEKLNLEQAMMIVQLRTVQPEGLNKSLEFHCKEDWYEFAAWYRNHRAKAAARTASETAI